MSTDPSNIRERAWVEYREPSISPVEEPVWVAEDPETQCLGVGDVEAEAVGNLVSVVTEWETDSTETDPVMKMPGRIITRPSMQESFSDSMFDSFRSLF